MATPAEGRFCRDDTQCSSEQYCYNVSERCVDYTQCSRYNRQENKRRSRHPSHCGQCLPGYTAEELGTGEMALLCRKTDTRENIFESGGLITLVISCAIIGVIFCAILVIVLFVRRRGSRRLNNNNIEESSDLCAVEPSAPPMERPFIDCGDGAQFNNNKNVKDKNKLVRAAMFNGPDWVCTNPNYENNLNNDNANALDQSNSSRDLPSTDNNTNTWALQQLPFTVVNNNRLEFEVERMSNSANVVRANSPSSSNATEEDSNNNSNDSTSDSNNAQDGRERNRSSNILIAPTISMNVHVLNTDC
ncbi:hybrid signal transduction histidine kinase M-like [Colletes gigas]|uniref:hybrid signal transduction histidine kinase M-like n=1 Tax=Colletes gigas TaxID=935657 RepID=UPI001C9A9DEF|nr:hybrid signal transduction histidine kinase M-like [Colletes gigas]